MELDELLNQFARTTIDYSELGDSFVGTVYGWKFDTDNRGRKAIFITVMTEDGKQVQFKYTSAFVEDLVNALKTLGFDTIDQIVQKKFIWQKKEYIISVGTGKTARYYPVRLFTE